MSEACDSCSCGVEDAEKRETAPLQMDFQEDIRDALVERGVVDDEDEFISAVVVCPESTRAYVRDAP